MYPLKCTFSVVGNVGVENIPNEILSRLFLHFIHIFTFIFEASPPTLYPFAVPAIYFRQFL